MTLLVFYLRLSPDQSFRRWCIATMILNTVVTVINWLLAFFQCMPLDAYFHPELNPDAKCIDGNVLLMNILVDIVILALPIRTVWMLNMSRRKKIAITCIIGFGVFSVIVAACRLAPLAELSDTDDISWVLGKMVIVASVEIQLAIVAVNLPAMKALVTRVTGGSIYNRSEPGDGNAYRLSSKVRNGKKVRSVGSRHNPAAPVVDVSITRHMASDSEEELWNHGNGFKVRVTKTVEIQSIHSDGETEGSGKTIQHPYTKAWA
ncbi:hypothetical protein VP1G_10972 [Cytospora mali]|uniref:Rhodopsin domain-containing protein n=1 Tax=Cytospora mali TaxID=578113 RepID=A0A194V1M6_CYTMA|nr:hypothetical protein VP1G_10972 [Valsa mali var. pyri (nom. inval.)]